MAGTRSEMDRPWLTVEDGRRLLSECRGEGIKVAILDSGVEAGHPDLGGVVLSDDCALVIEGSELKVVDGGGRDVYGHGTAVAGIVREMAPLAQIGSFRVLGAGLRSRSEVIAAGVQLALRRGYHVLNCSFGCSRTHQMLNYKSWVDEAYLKGRHIVSACNNSAFQNREWPAHFPSVISVNFASVTDPEAFYYQAGSLVEFAAAGQDLDVAWSGGGRKRVTGSSFAAPRVAGFLVRLLSGCPTLTTLEAKALLARLAVPGWPGSSAGVE